MGPCRNQPPPLPLPSLPLPVGLRLGNLGPSIPHASKKGFAGAYFLKLNFEVLVVGRRRTIGGTFTALTGNVAFWVAGEKKKNPLFVGSPPAEVGVSPRENELSASYCLPSPQFKPQTEEQ